MSTMAQTKRKRRTKHRGNAAGNIETRGRTGRKPDAATQKKTDRAALRRERLAQPPTWNKAIIRAGAAAVLLFVLTQIGLFQDDVPLSQALVASRSSRSSSCRPRSTTCSRCWSARSAAS